MWALAYSSFWNLRSELKLGLPMMGVSSGWGKLWLVSTMCVDMFVCVCLAAVARQMKQQQKGISGQAARNNGMHWGVVVKSEGRERRWSHPWLSLHSSVDVSECHVNGELHKL